MKKRLCASILIVLPVLMMTYRVAGAQLRQPSSFLILDLQSGTAALERDDGSLPSEAQSSSLTGSVRLAVEPFPCQASQPPSTVKLTGLAMTGTPLLIGSMTTGTFRLFLEASVSTPLASMDCQASSVPIDIQFRATLKLESSPDSFSLPLHFLGQLDLTARTMRATVSGDVPANVPVIGGRTLVLRLAFEPVPISALISAQGITSYGRYSRVAGGGGTAFVNMRPGEGAGTLVLDPVDFALPGRGISLVLERFYNGQDPTVGVFGRGWSSLLDVQWAVCGNQEIDQVPSCPNWAKLQYRDSSGAKYFFTEDVFSGEGGRAPGLGASMLVSLSPTEIGCIVGSTLVYDNRLTFTFAGSSCGNVWRLSTIQDRNGNTIIIKRDRERNPTLIRDSLGREVVITITPDFPSPGYRTVLITPPGGLAPISYEIFTSRSGDELLSQVTRADQTTHYGYEFDIDVRHDRLNSITDPRGYQTRFTYWKTQVLQDPCAGKITTIEFATEVVRPPQFDTYTYATCPGPAPLPPPGETRVTDPNGHTTRYQVEEGSMAPGPTTIIDAANRATHITYDPHTFAITQIDQALQSAHWEYEEPEHPSDVHRLLSVSQHDKGVTDVLVTTFEYWDSPQRCTLTTERPCRVHFVTNPERHRTEFDYDDRGNLQTVTNALGNTATLEYDAHGLLTQSKRPRGSTKFTPQYDHPDGSGNLHQLTMEDPLHRKSTVTYDNVSRPSAAIDAKHQTTTIAYDLLSRLKTVTYQDGPPVTFDYDAVTPENPNPKANIGNLTTMTDRTGKTQFPDYDHQNRLLTKILPNGEHITYTYDGVGNLTSKTDTGGTVVYTYDAVNRLSTLTEPDGAVVTYKPNDSDNSLTVDYPHGLTLHYEGDWLGRMTHIQATGFESFPTLPSETTLVDLTYGYNKGSTLLARFTDTDGILAEYVYDALNQLTAETKHTAAGQNAGISEWTYDANQNRKSEDLHGPPAMPGVTIYTYNDADELLATASRDCCVVYQHDENGNLTHREDGLTLEYNAADQTTAITPPPPAGGAAAKQTMEYSGVDQTQRVSLQIGNDPATTFTYDEIGIGPSSEQPGTTAGPLSYFTRTPGGQLVSLGHGDVHKFYYVTDRLGSVIALIGFDNRNFETFIANSYTYDPWGRILSEREDAFAKQPFRFASAEYDAATGLYKMGARYYAPDTGRFTQTDALGGGYAYGLNNPINVVDPSGYKGCQPEDGPYCTVVTAEPEPEGSSLDDPVFLMFVAQAANFAAGFGDVMSLGITYGIRELMGLNTEVDTRSPAYYVGQVTGIIAGAKGTAKGGWMNSNGNLRVGWGTRGRNSGLAPGDAFRITGKWVGGRHIDVLVIGR